jgi:hypothetical protein
MCQCSSAMLTLEVYWQVARGMVPALGAVSLGMLSSSSCLCLHSASDRTMTNTYDLRTCCYCLYASHQRMQLQLIMTRWRALKILLEGCFFAM